MKKVITLALSIWLLCSAAACLAANNHIRDRRFVGRDDYRRGYPVYRNDRSASHYAPSRIERDIRANERRIAKLEWRMNRYYRNDGYRGYHRGDREMRELEWQIRRLQERNQYLRSLLYNRGW